MIPIMREPTGLIIGPLRTESAPPAATAAAAAPSAGDPQPPPMREVRIKAQLAAWRFILLNSKPTRSFCLDTPGQ